MQRFKTSAFFEWRFRPRKNTVNVALKIHFVSPIPNPDVLRMQIHWRENDTLIGWNLAGLNFASQKIAWAWKQLKTTIFGHKWVQSFDWWFRPRKNTVNVALKLFLKKKTLMHRGNKYIKNSIFQAKTFESKQTTLVSL